MHVSVCYTSLLAKLNHVVPQRKRRPRTEIARNALRSLLSSHHIGVVRGWNSLVGLVQLIILQIIMYCTVQSVVGLKWIKRRRQSCYRCRLKQSKKTASEFRCSIREETNLLTIFLLLRAPTVNRCSAQDGWQTSASWMPYHSAGGSQLLGRAHLVDPPAPSSTSRPPPMPG